MRKTTHFVALSPAEVAALHYSVIVTNWPLPRSERAAAFRESFSLAERNVARSIYNRLRPWVRQGYVPGFWYMTPSSLEFVKRLIEFFNK